MEVYVVVSGEFTNCVEESSFMVRGVYQREEDAIRELKHLRDVSLAEFKDEYVESENDKQVIIQTNGDEDYIYQIEITKMTVS